MAKLVVKRYATALFDLGKSEDKLKQYEQEVRSIVQAINETPEFMQFLLDHKIPSESKIKLVEDSFKGKISDPVTGLLVLIVRKSRQDELVDILEGFLQMVDEESGIIKAEVTSAIPLSEAQLNSLKEKIEASTNSKVEIKTFVDESIIAGLVIKVGDRLVDASYKGQLADLKKQLSKLRLA